MVSAKTRSWGLAEEAKRTLEDKFIAADPNKPISDIRVKTATRPTIEKAVELYLSEKETQGIDATAIRNMFAN